MDQAKRLKAFDKENPRLKKQVADLSLDKQILVAIGRSVGRHGSQVVEGFEYFPGGIVKLTDLVPNQRLGKSLSC